MTIKVYSEGTPDFEVDEFLIWVEAKGGFTQITVQDGSGVEPRNDWLIVTEPEPNGATNCYAKRTVSRMMYKKSKPREAEVERAPVE